ncbi:type II toxin-antitoxin system MqsR family toxin [Flavobacterium difficile]|uniref:Type II toxin-antitoxin system MqsR family toxin n=1 Tax=Flavobacterium difficile TaxID=2709659 RepID=A0ABX0I5D9_9FLAO|nr:type II toxin-antitoxin system MqsR family toxin [Flavobacterium difficile]NHM02408.1 type II toxin-antitoxin system MqsR family toxin [Flavobacterium difficile]
MESEVKKFLTEFKINMNMFGILYANRDKNTQTLADLEITPKFRDNILLNLNIEDYCEGPIDNDQYGNNPMWVFGTNVKKNEIYVKITLLPSKAFCISFHIAEHPLTYPLKK